MTLEDSGVLFGSEYAISRQLFAVIRGALGTAETILSETNRNGIKKAFESGRIDRSRKGGLSQFEMSSSKSGSGPVVSLDRPGAQVKLNDSSSGDGVGRFLTTLWSAGSLSWAAVEWVMP